MSRDVHVIDHPLVQHKLTLMRKKDASTNSFRRLLGELSTLMAYEVTSDRGQFDASYLNGLIYQNLFFQLERLPGVANVSLLAADDGSGKGTSKYAIDLSK